jgi:hypothetical protein
MYMQTEDRISTWDVLKTFGFLPDDEVISDVRPGLSFDFGNFKLAASCCINMRFVEIVLFTGVMTTSRRISDVQFEMSRRVQSAEQCAAMIAWCLDKQAGNPLFIPARPVEWLAEGRKNRRLLPWNREKVKFEERPRCWVERNWLRVALKTLSQILATADNEEKVVLGFDGTVLTIRCKGKVLPLPAEGKPWPERYSLRAGKMRYLPKRLTSERLEVAVWETRLTIDGNSYEGITAIDSDIAAFGR